MIIQNSTLQWQARHDRLVTERSQERLEMWTGTRRPEPARESAPNARGTDGDGGTGRSGGWRGSGAENPWAAGLASSLAALFGTARPSATGAVGGATAQATADQPLAAVDHTRGKDRKDGHTLPPHLQTLARMIEVITGRPVKLLDGETLEPSPTTPSEGPPPAATAAEGATAPARQGWGLVYEATQTRIQTEHLRVQAQGEIRTADGRGIAFTLQLEMESVQIDTRHTSLRAGDAVLKDPLVLHFDGPVGKLRDTRFAFDLDADGQADQMPFVSSGSGFLVLDRNRNGQADNGSELFGTRTGDGFAELAAFDDDGNGWIDEADAVFQQLRVWRMDASGQTRLTSLADNGVGALSLSRVGSEMALRADPSGGQLGQLRSTGLYLTESGQAKALQQIDLVV